MSAPDHDRSPTDSIGTSSMSDSETINCYTLVMEGNLTIYTDKPILCYESLIKIVETWIDKYEGLNSRRALLAYVLSLLMKIMKPSERMGPYYLAKSSDQEVIKFCSDFKETQDFLGSYLWETRLTSKLGKTTLVFDCKLERTKRAGVNFYQYYKNSNTVWKEKTSLGHVCKVLGVEVGRSGSNGEVILRET